MAYAQIDEYFIERLHLLGKNEIIVYTSLCRRRNPISRQCNPSRKMIAEDTNLPKQRVSESISGLEEKGWIITTAEGFLLPEKVTESVTAKAVKSNRIRDVLSQNPLPKVTEFVTGVTESVTVLNKDLEKTNEKTKERTSNDVPKKRTPLSVQFSVTTEMNDWAARRVPLVDLDLETEKFRNYWTEKTGKAALKSDWELTWKNWMLNAATRYGAAPPKVSPEIAEFLAYVAAFDGRKTVVNEPEWFRVCRKLQTEGMSVHGMRSLYRYCREIAQIKVVTPKVMDWKFSEYREFLKNRQPRPAQSSSVPFNPNAIVIESSPLPRGY